MFQNTEIGFTKLLALSIKPVLFLNKEYIVRKGDIGSEVRCVNFAFTWNMSVGPSAPSCIG